MLTIHEIPCELNESFFYVTLIGNDMQQFIMVSVINFSNSHIL